MHPPIILKYTSLYKPCTGNANNLRARLPPHKHVPSIQKCIIQYHTINKNLCRKYRCATRKIGLYVIICVINEATCRARFLSQASTPSAKLCAVQDSNLGKQLCRQGRCTTTLPNFEKNIYKVFTHPSKCHSMSIFT